MSALTWHRSATGERISLVSGQAGADRLMIVSSALCIEAARAGTRVATLIADASQMNGAVLVNETLGPAVRGSAEHSGNAGTNGSTFGGATFGIRSARRRHARIYRAQDGLRF